MTFHSKILRPGRLWVAEATVFPEEFAHAH